METAHPILAQELGRVNLELRAGKSREEALQALAQRTGVQDLANFVTLLVQSDQLGASLSQTLRVQAAEMRSKRMMRAEETAQKLPVKLTIPLVLCILPAMFAVVLGPAIINVARNLLPHLAK
jgi:tight adherence protein C